MPWSIDPAHTTVGFSARHMGLSTVRGRFKDFDGKVEVDPADLTRTRGRVDIRTASVDTGNSDRDGHLRSPDFFDVEQYPVMTFEVKKIEPPADDRYQVTGELTIKGTARQVVLEYEHAGETTDPWGNQRFGGELTGTINRSDWGLTWNMALEAGGLLVSDKIKIEVEGQLAESKQAVEEEASSEAQRR